MAKCGMKMPTRSRRATEGLPAATEGLPAATEGLPAATEGLPATTEELLAAPEGLPVSQFCLTVNPQPKSMAEGNVEPKKQPVTDNGAYICPMCTEEIQEATDCMDGQEALLCEGECGCWLHRWCANVPKYRFQQLAQTAENFVCPTCTSEHQG